MSSLSRTGMMIFTGCCFIVSWLLSFHPSIATLESAFYRQLIELAPSFDLPVQLTHQSLSTVLHQLLLFSVFGLVVLYQRYINRTTLSIFFIILVAFSLLILQILLAILLQLWLPVIWPIVSFLFTTLVLYIWFRIPLVKASLFPDPVCNIETVREYLAQSDYNGAVLILKHCTFSEEMFELAYEIGLKLEQQKNWNLARLLYRWLVQFDPGMQDFVDRIDSIMSQDMDQDFSLTEITERRDQFGHYQLLGKKARGATATVYEAQDMNTHQRIALKILNQHLNDDTGERDIMTFLHEAMTVSHLDHPNIVKIHDADIIGDQAYIAMDYISGYPMSERLRRKKLLTSAESLRVMRSVLNALVKAHQQGIVHGDIKPANIMYDQQRKAYIITDFGAAYSSHHGSDRSGKITGTPAYMSPEQLTGGRIDGRSDLFSLAVTMYHLLSGRQPFTGDRLPELKKSVLEDEVDLDCLTVPTAVKQILDKALQKKTYQRFADAGQMLQAVVHSEQILVTKQHQA
jgi:serine/threonine-protein kinase